MAKSYFSIAITSLVVLIYVLCTSLGVAFPVLFILLLSSQVLLVWMVIRILKDPNHSQRKFDNYFYEDADIRSDGNADGH